MHYPNPKKINAALLLAFGLLLMLHVKTFTLWSQVSVLTDVSPLYLIQIFHPHSLRYLVVWPAVFLSHATGADINIIFSFYALALIFLMSLTLGKILRSLSPDHSSAWNTTIFLAIWLFISLFMNGRLVFAFTGISIIIYAQMVFLSNPPYRRNKFYSFIALQITGLLLCSVSTGTFSVAFCVVEMFLIGFPLIQYLKEGKFLRRLALANLLILIFFVPFEAQFLVKNVCFFAKLPLCESLLYAVPEEDTSLLSDNAIKAEKDPYSLAIGENAGALGRSLAHGPLRRLLALDFSLESIELLFYFIFPAALLITLFLYFKQLSKISVSAPLIASIGISATIGLFGDSTFLMLLPAFTLLAVRSPGGKPTIYNNILPCHIAGSIGGKE